LPLRSCGSILVCQLADYSAQIADLLAAAEICQRHTITTAVNGIYPEYPRWPAAWAACEVVWRNYLDAQTMAGVDDEAERETVLKEARKLR
jgi:sugar/nucleoside kinase (ribokinase family)